MDWLGSPLGRGGKGTLTVDGKQVAERSPPKTQPIVWAWDETFDVGSDTGTGVDDSDYKVPFTFTGKLDKITVDLGESTVSPAIIKKMMEELSQKKDD